MQRARLGTVRVMTEPKVVSREEWLRARRALLAKEKEFTRTRDALSAERRELPMVKLEKAYRFDGPNGSETLSDLFAGRSQLLVYHFMFGTDWEEGCPSCSFWADNFNGVTEHLAARDVTMIAISTAPLEKLEAYKQRLGWRFKWLSSAGSDFNSDFGVSFSAEEKSSVTYNFKDGSSVGEEMPGASTFYKNNEGEIFHAYSTYARGLDMLNGAYHYLDIVPKGRDEGDLGFTMAWLKRRDQY